MALRPRLWPGVPVSRCGATIGPYIREVKTTEVGQRELKSGQREFMVKRRYGA